MEPKQVIVMRKDLNMRKGKMICQGSHASLAIVLDMMIGYIIKVISKANEKL
jgi:peptidyl-tRNA hydrolase